MLPIAHVTAGLALILATIVDLKQREVPDTVSYGTILVGVALGIIESATAQAWEPLLTALGGLGFGLGIGLLMFFAGQWGGGDAKLVAGLGALFGMGGFLYTFLILTVIAGGVYGILYGAGIAVARRKAFAKEFKKLTRNQSMKKIRLSFQAAVALALILGLFVLETVALKITVVLLAAGAYLLFYAWLFARALEEGCMKVKTPVDKLVEGDWVLETVTVGGETITPAKYGITKTQIARLQRSKTKKVLVKEGIPFVPSFLLAYIGALAASVAGWTPTILL